MNNSWNHSSGRFDDFNFGFHWHWEYVQLFYLDFDRSRFFLIFDNRGRLWLDWDWLGLRNGLRNGLRFGDRFGDRFGLRDRLRLNNGLRFDDRFGLGFCDGLRLCDGLGLRWRRCYVLSLNFLLNLGIFDTVESNIAVITPRLYVLSDV